MPCTGASLAPGGAAEFPTLLLPSLEINSALPPSCSVLSVKLYLLFVSAFLLYFIRIWDTAEANNFKTGHAPFGFLGCLRQVVKVFRHLMPIEIEFIWNQPLKDGGIFEGRAGPQCLGVWGFFLFCFNLWPRSLLFRPPPPLF